MCVGKLVRVHRSAAPDLAKACALSAASTSLSTTTARTGILTADATAQASNGYLLTVVCGCGVVFERWVTSIDADADLISWAQLEAVGLRPVTSRRSPAASLAPGIKCP